MAAALYLIRHCESSGPDPHSPLTERGHEQAKHLADRMADLGICRLVSSPYLRTLQTIAPLAERLNLQVEQDSRLVERRGDWVPDRDAWVDLVRKTFDDFDLALDDRETSRAAQIRGIAAIHDVIGQGIFPAAIVGHGQLSSLILGVLSGLDPFDTWLALTNPDVFAVTALANGYEVTRFWS